MGEQSGVVTSRRTSVTIPGGTLVEVPPSRIIVEWVIATAGIGVAVLVLRETVADHAAQAFWNHPTRALVSVFLGIALSSAITSLAIAGRGLRTRGVLAGAALIGVLLGVAILLLSDAALAAVFGAGFVATTWATITTSSILRFARGGRVPLYEYALPDELTDAGVDTQPPTG